MKEDNLRKETLEMCFWTRAAINRIEGATKMLAALASVAPDWFPLDWGYTDDRTAIKTASDFGPIVDIWERLASGCGETMYGSRRKPKTSLLVAFLCKPSLEPHRISFAIKDLVADEELAIASKALELFRRWAAILGADYGRLCAGGEWERKNVIEQYEEPDGSIDPWMVFQQDITTGLPGVYWATYFGKAYVDWFGGADRFENAPWPHVESCGDGFLLLRSESPFTWGQERSLDGQLCEWLGDDAFFELDRRDRTLRAPKLEIPDPYSHVAGRVSIAAAKRTMRRALPRRPRAGRERLRELANAGDLVNKVAFFRSIGFFDKWASEDDEDVAGALYDLHERQWGTGFSEQAWLADLELLRWDTSRIWWEDLEADVGPGNNVYVKTLTAWSKISRGAFHATRVKEDWSGERGPIHVSFRYAGGRHLVRPNFVDDFIDVHSLLGAINSLILPSGKAFCIYEPFDQTAFVVVLTAVEYAAIQQERGWRFLPSVWPGTA